jgi:hypothetical protein
MKYILTFLAFIISIYCCKANGAVPINYDTYIEDSIGVKGEIDAFTFNGTAGEHITLRVNAISNGEFESKVELVMPSGKIDTVNWDSYDYPYGGDIQQVQFIDYPLKESGQYSIFISEKDGAQTSSYWLSLQCREQVKLNAVPITYDTYRNDTISPLGDIDAFKFNGTAGEHITLRVNAISNGEFESKVELVMPSGKIDTVNWDSYDYPYGGDIQQVQFIDYPLKESGQYSIFISEKDGAQTSTYWLSIQNKEDILSRADTLKTNKGNLVQNFENFGSVKAFVFLVNTNDTTSFSITRKSGSVEPQIQLWGSSDSLLLTTSNQTKVNINDDVFTESGRYILFVNDNNGDATGSFEMTWTGLTTNLINIVEISAPDSIIQINKSVNPEAIVTNIGWKTQTFTIKTNIYNVYNDSIANLTLAPFKTDTITFKKWVPIEAAAYSANVSTIVKSILSNQKSKRVTVSKGFGPEIYSRNPQTGENGGKYTIDIVGSRFQPKLKAVLFNANHTGIVAESYDLKFVDSCHIKATFDFTDEPESMFHLKVINPDGNEFTFYEAFKVKQFNGSEIEFNRWQEVYIPINSKKLYSINVPENTKNLFFLVRKSTKIGHHGTWTGKIKIFWQDKLISEKEGMEDFDLQLKNAAGGRYFVEVWSNDEARAQIKACDNLDQLTFGEWHKGLVLKGWGHDWTQIDVPANADTLFFETQGFGIYSNLQIFRETLGSVGEHWYFDKYQQGYHLTGKILKPKAGRYLFKYEDSDNVVGGTSQERDYLLNVDIITITTLPQDQKPVITGLSTYKVGQGQVTIDVFGKLLEPSAIISIINQENDTIVAYNVIKDSIDSKLLVSFNLNNAKIGRYTFLYNDSNHLLTGGVLEITQDNKNDIQIEILGRSIIRTGRNQQYILKIYNNSSIDLFDLIADIELPLSYNYYLKIPIVNELINGLKIGYELNNSTQIPIFIYKIQAKSFIEIPLYINNLNSINVLQLKSASNYIKVTVVKTKSVRITRNGYTTENITESQIYQYVRDGIKNYAEENSYSLPSNYENDLQKSIGEIINGTLSFGIPISLMASSICDIPGLQIPCIPVYIGSIGYGAWGLYWGLVDYFKAIIKRIEIDPVGSSTPEDKYGTKGFGEGGNIAKDQKLIYRIDFWNHEKATAPAQQVFIKDTLSTFLNDTTLTFTEFGFLKWKVPLNAGQYFNVNVDMRPDMNLILNAVGKYNYTNREISYTFRSLDPLTMELTEEPLLGFLPPIDSTGYQIGWVEYQIESIKNLPTGASIKNRAWVNFDGVGPTNPAPKLAPWTNTIDDISPISFVNKLPEIVEADSVLVSWQGSDIGAGVKNYFIYYSVNGSDFKLWQTTSNTEVLFKGEYGSTYEFYSIATDYVGNKEADKIEAEAYIKMVGQTSGLGAIKANSNDDENVKVYPNPTENGKEFNVVIKNNDSNLQGGSLIVYSISGQIIFKRSGLQPEMKLGVFSRGYYLIEINLANGNCVNKKIIVD